MRETSSAGRESNLRGSERGDVKATDGGVLEVIARNFVYMKRPKLKIFQGWDLGTKFGTESVKQCSTVNPCHAETVMVGLYSGYPSPAEKRCSEDGVGADDSLELRLLIVLATSTRVNFRHHPDMTSVLPCDRKTGSDPSSKLSG